MNCPFSYPDIRWRHVELRQCLFHYRQNSETEKTIGLGVSKLSLTLSLIKTLVSRVKNYRKVTYRNVIASVNLSR